MQGESASAASQTFAQLLSAARSGDRGALGRLLVAYQPILIACARSRFPADLRAKFDPLDLVQETHVKALRDFGSFAGSTEPGLIAWLKRILAHTRANLIRDYRTSPKRRVGCEQPLSAGLSVLSVVDGEPISNALGPEAEAILRELTEEWRHILETRSDKNRDVQRTRIEERLFHLEKLAV